MYSFHLNAMYGTVGYFIIRTEIDVCLNIDRSLQSVQNTIVDPGRLVKCGWITVLQALLK